MNDKKAGSIRFRVFASLLLALGLLGPGACATDPGAELQCPTCDGVSELLVGSRCVPIDQIEECGPDGHSHGSECHCFSDQEPTVIAGRTFCLQRGCAEQDAGSHEDHDGGLHEHEDCSDHDHEDGDEHEHEHEHEQPEEPAAGGRR